MIKRREWFEDSMSLEVEIKLTVDWHCNDEHMYFSAFVAGDEYGRHDLADLLTKDETEHIMDCITEAYDKMRREKNG